MQTLNLPPTENIGLLLKAVNFAAIKHSFQKRKGDDSPYINHPIGVCWNIYNIGGISDINALVGALLHEYSLRVLFTIFTICSTVEDTDTTFEEIETNFGTKIRKIVEEVTDDKSLPKGTITREDYTLDERKRQQIVHAAHASYEAKLVKLSDKL